MQKKYFKVLWAFYVQKLITQELDYKWACIAAKRDRGLKHPLSNTSGKDLASVIFFHKRATHCLPATEV